MIAMRRTAPILSAVVLAVVALSGCGAKDTAKEATSSAPSSAAAMTTTSTPATKPAGDKVAPADLAAIVANRTHRGEADGKPYAEYYTTDGAVRGKTGGETYAGSWKVVGEQLCFTYPEPGKAEEVDCYSVFTNGDTVTWTGADGGVTQTVSVDGNPDNL